MRQNNHVINEDGKWTVLKEGSRRLKKVFETKADALFYAYDNSRDDDTCVYVHDVEGKVRSVKCPKRQTTSLLRRFQEKYGLKY